MRMALDIDDTLLKKAKARARQTLAGTTHAGAAPTHRFTLKTVKGSLLPGVDISDRDSLYERMEGRS